MRALSGSFPVVIVIQIRKKVGLYQGERGGGAISSDSGYC
jgi:hypothetical protein